MATTKICEWLRHQTSGDLDEGKLIEGIVGEKAIYRRRGEREPELGAPVLKPKLARLLVDVSGSMYRFNGHDGRLQRQLEAVTMIMEALQGAETRMQYEVYGHSGEGHSFQFVSADRPPRNNKQRLDVLKQMHAHAQFCLSGDHTLNAVRHAVSDVTSRDADEHYVIVLSDANLSRYGIPPKRLAAALMAAEKVRTYVIFIGSLGDQAKT